MGKKAFFVGGGLMTAFQLYQTSAYSSLRLVFLYTEILRER